MELTCRIKGLDKVRLRDVIDMEQKILFAFNWNLNFTTPIFFLDRLQRLMNLDQESVSPKAKKIGKLARTICAHTVDKSQFLDFKPSHIAAASLMLAYNIAQKDFNLAES